MKDYFTLRQELNEAKVSIAKLKPGLKVNVIHTGRSAQNYGVSGQNVYGGRVQVLGLGSVPSGKPAEKKHVLAKNYKDLQQKYKHIWDTDDIKYGNFWNAQNRMKIFMRAIADESKGKKVPYGHTSWIWQIIEGPNKGKIHYCFISSDDRWEVVFLNKSTDFTLET